MPRQRQKGKIRSMLPLPPGLPGPALRLLQGKRVLRCLGLLLSFGLSLLISSQAWAASSGGPSGSDPFAPYAGPAKDICVGDPIPQGWIITVRGYAPSRCNHDDRSPIPILQPIVQPIANVGLNAFIIQPAPATPGSTTEACQGSTLTPGMVIIRDWPFNPNCTGPSQTFMRVKDGPMTICAESPVPPGYQITGTTYSTACGLLGQNTEAVAPLHPGEGETR